MTNFSFSPWHLFLHANIVVQSVMIILILACLLSWSLCLAKLIEILIINHTLSIDKSRLQKAKKINSDLELTSKGIGKKMLIAVLEEYHDSKLLIHDPEGLKERIVLILERIEANEGHYLNRWTGLLATIGATAPFIGLFGTVWGIMTSFTGIVAAQATSLMVVAPGIAEALMATAIGLVTAIPAVIFYNILNRSNSYCRAKIANLGTLIMRLVSREISELQRKPNSGQIIPFNPKTAGEIKS